MSEDSPLVEAREASAYWFEAYQGADARAERLAAALREILEQDSPAVIHRIALRALEPDRG